MKHKMIRKIISFSILAIFEFTNISIPYVQAQEVNPVIQIDSRLPDATPDLGEAISNAKIDEEGLIAPVPEADKLMISLPDAKPANASARKPRPFSFRNKAKKDFRASEDAIITLNNPDQQTISASVKDTKGNSLEIDPVISTDSDTTRIRFSRPRNFKPGKYKITLTDSSGVKLTQDFTWGVLAINTDKSVYLPQEKADIAMAVLDETGEMVCDASVELIIQNYALGISETLSTENGKITVNPECESHDFTLKPDYEARIQVEGAGVYDMKLTAVTKNGTYTIIDSFEVRDYVPLDVKRISATRIYPPLSYPVMMEIEAREDFAGTITDTVPGDFQIQNLDDETVRSPLVGERTASAPTEVLGIQTEAPAGQTDTSEAESATPSATTVSPTVTPTPEPETAVPNEATPEATLAEPAGDGTSTVSNDIQLGNFIPGLVPSLNLPFAGTHPISLRFTEHLVDTYQRDLYRRFGMLGHDGIDFAMPIGTPILAVDDGDVLLADRGDYGITVVIQHSWGRSYYGHLSETIAKKGEKVTKGSKIALSGNTGITTGPHLHFGIKPSKNDLANGYYGKIDPAVYLGLAPTVALAAAPTLPSVLGASVSSAPVKQESRELVWNVNLKKGEKIKIGYSYNAPLVSPQFYSLGPAVFKNSDGQEIFRETRTWSIAADAMDFKFKKGSFAKSTCDESEGGCLQAITGVGFQPKALIFFWTQQTSSAYAVDNAYGMGLATESANFAVFNRADDNLASSFTGTAKSLNNCIYFRQVENPSNTLYAQANIESMDSDGFTLKWTTNDASAYIIHYIALGGADITNAAAGSVTVATSGSPQTFSTVGFRPDFLLIATGHYADATTPNAHFSLGFTDGTNQRNLVVHSQSGSNSTTGKERRQVTDKIVSSVDSGGIGSGFNLDASFNSFTASGFSLNVTSWPEEVGGHSIYYLALKGGRYNVGSFDQRTSLGTTQVTTGFQPSGVMLASFGTTTNATNTTDKRLSIGAASAEPSIAEGSIWSGDRVISPAANSDANMYTNALKVISMADTTTTLADADLSAFGTTSFTLNWTTVDLTAREIIYWAAGDVGAAQEDYKWYKNANSTTPGAVMQEENTAAIVSQTQPYVRLRMNVQISGGAGLYAQSQKFKLQYATATAPSTWVDVASPWCSDASPACNTSWQYRKKITFDNSSSGENLTNFPVMVKLTSSNISWGDVRNDGFDVRFVDPSDHTTVLSYERETWTDNTEGIFWVKVPQIDAHSTSDYIWMYYNNPAAADGQAADVWSNNYSAVWEFNEGSGTTTADRSGNGNTSTVVTTPLWVTGKIGSAVNVAGNTANGWHANDSADFNGGAGTKLTVKFWVRPTTFVDWARMVHKEEWNGNGSWYIQQADPGDTAPDNYINAAVKIGSTFETTQSRSEFPMSTATWYLITVTHDGRYLRIYLNGVETHNFGNDYPGTVADSAYCVNIGYGGGGTGGTCETNMQSPYNGYFDQVYVSNTVARSADWIMAEYKSENNSYCTYDSTPEQQSTTDWFFMDNAAVTNGGTIAAPPLLSSTAGTQESYQEANPTVLNPTAMTDGQKREWDFALDGTNATLRETYYFRFVTDSDITINYTRYPTLTVGPPLAILMRHGKWFNYQVEEPFTF